MVSVNLRNLRALRRAIKKYGEVFEAEVVRGTRRVARFGVRAVGETSRETNPRPRAFGNYERSWQAKRTRDGAMIVNTARHAIFVEKGRGPGRAPPINPIIRWVIQKRLVSWGRGQRGRAAHVAYLIARKIARKGTKGRWILRRTMPKIRRRMLREIDRAHQRVLQSVPR